VLAVVGVQLGGIAPNIHASFRFELEPIRDLPHDCGEGSLRQPRPCRYGIYIHLHLFFARHTMQKIKV
jgi:hypothetical protein